MPRTEYQKMERIARVGATEDSPAKQTGRVYSGNSATLAGCASCPPPQEHKARAAPPSPPGRSRFSLPSSASPKAQMSCRWPCLLLGCSAACKCRNLSIVRNERSSFVLPQPSGAASRNVSRRCEFSRRTRRSPPSAPLTRPARRPAGPQLRAFFHGKA